MNNILEVPNKNILYKLINHKENEVVKVLDENKLYKFNNGAWEEYNQSVSLSLYEINKQYYFNKEDINLQNSRSLIYSFINNTNGQYYMLLNKELSYYTLFKINCKNGSASLPTELFNILQEFAHIKSIELNQETNALEIWVVTEEQQVLMFVLFNYDRGVVECL